MQTESLSETVIKVAGLTKTFGRFTAVDHLTFSIGCGEIFGFLGPNGAGKSTTIRMLCGLLEPTEGKAFVGGFDVGRNPEDVRANIGYMSQKFSLYKDLTVIENIKFFGGVYGLGGERLQKRIAAVIDFGGLAGLENAVTGTLSGALQQRLALGCAILHEPPILFLDEPTSGIDPISRRMFWDIIRDMAARRVTILVTTHFLDEAELCDRLGFIASGKLIAMGRPGELKQTAVEEDLFEVTLSSPSFAKQETYGESQERMASTFSAAADSADKSEGSAQASLLGAREKVKQIEGVRDVSYFGRNLHVFCRRGAFQAGNLELEIRERGLTPLGVRVITPRLEDAFIRLATLAKP
ncbi:MAG: ABC transporter ATP-binding protein [Kiritimatiellia bacterium]|nr:ABC transporter ATP-binding protein [Kiritimatiellia bacterium]